jgi:CheY-like chemotaxis protein
LLAGGIAHDFNNLLVGVIGNASLAQKLLPAGHDVAEYLEEILKSGEKAAHLTRQMLAYAGKGRFEVQPLNLSAVVEEMSGLVRSSISRAVLLRTNLEPDLPAVEADPGQIEQVVMNLLINAAEAIGDKSGLIAVQTGVRDLDKGHIDLELEDADIRPGRYVFLEVRDNGCGLDEATKARIFDPFFTTKFMGRGLGLAAVAGIVRAHRGAIKVSSTSDKGSSFLVLFPAGNRAAAAPAPARQEDERLVGSGTILLVDDEETVRGLAKKTLEQYGYDVLVADSGPAAIAIFKRASNRISLVILDLSMPGMDGRATLPELLKIKPDVAVIISSGYSEAETLNLFAESHIAGFIQKPYTARQLAMKVKATLMSES